MHIVCLIMEVDCPLDLSLHLAAVEVKHSYGRAIFGPAEECEATNQQAAPFTHSADLQQRHIRWCVPSIGELVCTYSEIYSSLQLFMII